MGGMSLNDSQHAPRGTERSAYIPPHMRTRGGPPPGGPAGFDGPPPMANGGGPGPAWPAPAQAKYVIACHGLITTQHNTDYRL